jgi:hypothetical protein
MEKPRHWYVFDPAMVLPEYYVSFDYILDVSTH